MKSRGRPKKSREGQKVQKKQQSNFIEETDSISVNHQQRKRKYVRGPYNKSKDALQANNSGQKTYVRGPYKKRNTSSNMNDDS